MPRNNIPTASAKKSNEDTTPPLAYGHIVIEGGKQDGTDQQVAGFKIFEGAMLHKLFTEDENGDVLFDLEELLEEHGELSQEMTFKVILRAPKTAAPKVAPKPVKLAWTPKVAE